MRVGNRIFSSLVVVLAVTIGGPASAGHEGIHPTFRSERVYFHCAGVNKVQNLGIITDGTPSWNTTAPSQSFQQGAGCGTFDPGQARGTGQETVYDVAFKGKFTGNLRSMTVELYNLALGRIRPGAMFVLRVRMSIDGVAVFPETGGNFVNVIPVSTSTGLESFVFTIKGLGCAREVVDADGNVTNVKTAGLAAEDGDGATDREILLTIDSGIIGETAQRQNSLWVWDATEVPAGITFNPDKIESSTVPVERAAFC